MEFELPQDFKELFELLNANNVRYLMLGGYAVGAYGYPRATNDLDIFVSDDEANIENLIRCLAQFGFGERISNSVLSKPRSIIEMGVEPIKIQLMNFADGIDFEVAFARRNILEIEGIEVSVVSKEDLIRNKKAVGRYKDLADVERLEKLN
jgi:predicted nucleotidyltransferase